MTLLGASSGAVLRRESKQEQAVPQFQTSGTINDKSNNNVVLTVRRLKN